MKKVRDSDILKRATELGLIAPDEDATVSRVRPSGGCEFCGKVAELRPYGPKGESVCFHCAQKDKKAAERRMSKVLFREG